MEADGEGGGVEYFIIYYYRFTSFLPIGHNRQHTMSYHYYFIQSRLFEVTHEDFIALPPIDR